MSTLAKRFVKNLEARGLRIEHRGGDRFVLLGPDKEKTPEIIQGCKMFKADIMEMFAPQVQEAAEQADNPDNTMKVEPVAQTERQCRKCNATVLDPQAAGAICDNILSCPYKMQECANYDN